MTHSPTLRTTLARRMQKNLADYETTIREDIANGVFLPAPIIVHPMDRAKSKVYSQRYTIDMVPMLTTSNKYLFKMASADVGGPAG